MSIVRIQKRENPYAQIDKTCLEDARLSWKAKGVLTYLLSKPDQWRLNIDDLKKRSKDGRDSIYSALAELRAAGYAELVNSFDENNKLLGKEWIIHETAISGKSRNGKIPNRENPDISNNDSLSDNENTAASEKDAAYTFEMFWNDYGYKKGSKAKAMSRFRKLTGRDIEALRAALPHYLRNTVTKDTGDRKSGFKPMRKYPEFFLSARAWESIADELNEKHEQTTLAAEQDPEYSRYMEWVKSKYPNLLNAAKYMSRTEYQTFRSAYSGKKTIGANLEQTYMIRAHEDMEKDCTKLEQYNGVFALHLDRVQQFVKQTTV